MPFTFNWKMVLYFSPEMRSRPRPLSDNYLMFIKVNYTVEGSVLNRDQLEKDGVYFEA